MLVRSMLFVILLPAVVAAEDLAAFLNAATEAVRPKAAVRAFGKAVTTSPDGSTEDEIAVVRKDGSLYLELRKARTRVLILDSGKEAFISEGGGKSAPFALDTQLGTTPFTREDLHPFDTARYVAPRISDLGPYDLTATLEPKPSQYALIVMTFERQRKLPTKTLYYKDAPNNLTKMRQDGEFAAVGDAFLPGNISMQEFQLRAKTTFTLKWEAAEAPAGILERAGLDETSPVVWP